MGQWTVSYLDTPQLRFAGDFQADVSTVNNDVRHYDVATFEPRFQQPREGTGPRNGWWNPMGGAAFRLIGCTVQDARTDADAAAASDPLVSAHVSSGPERSSGKMVDLDPQMQMTSELWGVRIQIHAADGRVFLEGDLHATGFRDLQGRQVAQQSRNGQPRGGTWDSVLEHVVWGEAAADSPTLVALRAATQDDRLAIHLTGYGYYYTHADGRFAMGRLLGVLGPYAAGDPVRFAPTRRLYGGNSFAYSNFVQRADRVTVDLGMSFPILDPLGTAQPQPDLRLAVARADGVMAGTTLTPAETIEIGAIDASADRWLERSAGIVTMPLSGEAATHLRDHPLVLLGAGDTVLAAEAPGGLYVRADQNVQRLDPGDSAGVDFLATQWGAPLSGATVHVQMARPSRPGGTPGPNPPTAEVPIMNQPASALEFQRTLTTDAAGRARLDLTGRDPRNPRGYIDGQIYQLPYTMNGLVPRQAYWLDHVLVHVRDHQAVPAEPTWREVGPILTQFGNLYPLMSHHLVDLGSEDDVRKHRHIVRFALTRTIDDPTYMPVTRDLSADKLALILRWLDNPVATPEEEGLEGAAPSPAAPETVAESAEGRPGGLQMTAERFDALVMDDGGKLSALQGMRDQLDPPEDEETD